MKNQEAIDSDSVKLPETEVTIADPATEIKRLKAEEAKLKALLKKASTSLYQFTELLKKKDEELEKANSKISTIKAKKKQFKTQSEDLAKECSKLKEELGLKNKDNYFNESEETYLKKIADLELSLSKYKEDLQHESELRAQEQQNQKLLNNVIKTHKEKTYEYEEKISSLEKSLQQITEEFTSYKVRAREALSHNQMVSQNTATVPIDIQAVPKTTTPQQQKENEELRNSIIELEQAHKRQIEQLERVNSKLKKQLEDNKKDNQVPGKVNALENQISVLQKEVQQKTLHEESRRTEYLEQIKAISENSQLEIKQITENYEQQLSDERKRFAEYKQEISTLLQQKQTEISNLKDTIEVMEQHPSSTKETVQRDTEDTLSAFAAFQSDKEEEISRALKKNSRIRKRT